MLLILLLVIISESTAFYSKIQSVIELREDNFDTIVLNDDRIWFIEFFAPWCNPCRKLAPEYIKAAEALKGIAKFGAVNADENQNLQKRFAIKTYPSIKMFIWDKTKPEDYSGSREAAGLVSAAFAAISRKLSRFLGDDFEHEEDDLVIELTDQNFSREVIESNSSWAIKFTAPWCKHCHSLDPEWSIAAEELQDLVVFGTIDATVNTKTSEKYNINGYPTIKFFSKQDKHSPIDYLGPRQASHMIKWFLEMVYDTDEMDLTELTSQAVFDEACDRKLCLIAVLPLLIDCQSNCRLEYLDQLKNISNMFRINLWGWLWCEAHSQKELESAFHLDFGYPTLVAFNRHRRKYSVLKGSFSFKGIHEFIREISFGRGSSYLLSKDFKIAPTKPWDGKDAKLDHEEEL